MRGFLIVGASVLGACLPACPEKRPAAPWPPPSGQIRVIIDTDVANEVDDQFALALALGSPERLKIEGFVAAHFGLAGGSAGISRSFDEIERVLLAKIVPFTR